MQAFLNTIQRIEAHYEKLSLCDPPLEGRSYPYKTFYHDESGNQIKFRYTERIFPHKLVFRAMTCPDGTQLCVNFTTQYSKDAHYFLAKLGYAPRLHAVTELPGGWNMVVMEFSPYLLLDTLNLVLPSEVRAILKPKIMYAVHLLRRQGFVHGDIRPGNILVDEAILGGDTYAFHILDFDWARRRIGEAVYPPFINKKTIRRPEDISGGQPITVEHDIQMAEWSL
ncbi:hypothetical protein AMATHDRAFT_154269 [Amanita thiersii Skay4041]|uniref:Protein kinase domain-containing protein n=1 Tax=Amanita thiersii Skay4041 TaxID=703135 RepID=A0A2A9NEE4_9AGAR|nr:hypothetical protein AMATHDRAFT_154269 [Amanita thiersii Skay4041]